MALYLSVFHIYGFLAARFRDGSPNNRERRVSEQNNYNINIYLHDMDTSLYEHIYPHNNIRSELLLSHFLREETEAQKS